MKVKLNQISVIGN